MKKYSISAFFPVYNDEETVELMATKLTKTLKGLTDDYEIIIVDDCSPDKSGKIADELAEKDNHIKAIHHKKNKGYGGALQTGFNSATKELVFYTDGDAQYDVTELTKLMEHIDDYDFVTGVKMKRADKLYRIIVSKVYYNMIKILFGIRVKDISGDFRLFRKEVVDNLHLTSNSGTICLEMVKRIQNRKYRTKEVPVHHYERVSGDSAYFHPLAIFKTLAELVPLWWELVIRDKFVIKNERKKV